jgi:hypothetical protein
VLPHGGESLPRDFEQSGVAVQQQIGVRLMFETPDAAAESNTRAKSPRVPDEQSMPSRNPLPEARSTAVSDGVDAST